MTITTTNIIPLLLKIECTATRIITYLLLIAVVSRYRSKLSSKRTFQRLDALFSPKVCGVYPNTASTPRIDSLHRSHNNSDTKEYDIGVLCIGGFGDAPMYFDPLLQCLKQQQHNSIFYYAPRTPGWARSSFDEAMNVSYEDWIVAGWEALYLASRLCHKVRIVAHSTGALVVAAVLLMDSSVSTSTSISEAVDTVVFTGSNFLPAQKDRSVKRLLIHTPFVAPVMKFIKPIISKRLREGRPVDTIRQEYHNTGFYLLDFPLNAVIEMWKLQDWLLLCTKVDGCRIFANTGQSNLHKKIVFLQGEFDKSVGPLEEQVDYVRSQLLTMGKGGNSSSSDVAIEYELVENAAHNLCGENEIVLQRISHALMPKI